MTEWNAADYARHSSLQEAMAQEVLAHLELRNAARILDVGCGDGRVTAAIAARTPSASVLGIDPSRDMIKFAQSHFGPGTHPNLRFEEGDARSLSLQDEFDLVVSFNALHWVPEQSRALDSIDSALVTGGRAQLRMVVAGPRPSLEFIVEEIRQLPQWSSYFADFRDPYLRLTSDEYAALAERHGFRVLDVRVKDHAWDFGSYEAFAAFSGVGCVEWTRRLPEADRSVFIDQVLDRYRAVIANGSPDEGNTFKFYQMDIGLLAV